jgi:hypothetical protein
MIEIKQRLRHDAASFARLETAFALQKLPEPVARAVDAVLTYMRRGYLTSPDRPSSWNCAVLESAEDIYAQGITLASRQHGWTTKRIVQASHNYKSVQTGIAWPRYRLHIVQCSRETLSRIPALVECHFFIPNEFLSESEMDLLDSSPDNAIFP